MITTDRKDLEMQLFDIFVRIEEIMEKPVCAEDCTHLRKLLEESRRIVFITIQKFSREELIFPHLSNRSDVIVIVNEAHRSQYGTLATNMRIALPNASFIGFTSIPLLNKEKILNMFGNYIYIYSLQQAINDGFKVPIYFEKRLPELHLSNPINLMDESEYGAENGFQVSNSLSSETRQKMIAKDIVSHFLSKKQKGKAMVICINKMAVMRMYTYVQEYWRDYKESLREKLASNPQDVMEVDNKLKFIDETTMSIVTSNIYNVEEKYGAKFRDPNDPLRIVFVCSMWINGLDVPSLDTIYLDKPMKEDLLIQLVSQVSQRFDIKNYGTIVDYIGISSITKISEITGLPSSESIDVYKEEVEIERLKGIIAKSSFTEGRTCLKNIMALNTEKGQQLAEELSFLYNLDITLEEDQKIWERRKLEVEWRRKIWAIMSANNVIELEKVVTDGKTSTQVESETSLDQETESKDEVISINDNCLTPQEKGQKLEYAVFDLLKEFFNICEESRGDVLEMLRKQPSGPQYGFDLQFKYLNKSNEKVECKIECKYYSSLISLENVSPKLEQARLFDKKFEHWILISPQAEMNTNLNLALKTWEEENRWSPFKVQIWTPENGVKKFFGIIPEVYDNFYIHNDNESHPKNWSIDEKEKNIADWRRRLEPPLQLPEQWAEYIRKPEKLLLKKEDNKVYSPLFDKAVEMKCKDEAGKIIQGTIYEYIRSWLNEKSKPTIILLGEFGDGKTFFTYLLSRRLTEEFRQSPKTGWIPIRFSLQDFGNESVHDSQDFLERRLKQFGVDLNSWNKVKQINNILVILDGFDEMSKRLDNDTIIKNTKRLIDCYEQEFEGLKVLITSRKHFFEDKKNKERLLQRIGSPDIIQISSIERTETLEHLRNFAQSPKEKEKLKSLQNIHDPIGLASKPLFLQMVKDTLADLPEENLNELIIYDKYARKSLLRKIGLQLEDENLNTSQENIIDNMLQILEKVALKLQETDKEYFCLSELAINPGTKDLARQLWEITDTDYLTTDDATARIAVRSLLVRVETGDESNWPVDFCHRSMREYFVAMGFCRLLLEDLPAVEELFKGCYLNYEEVLFASQYIKDKPEYRAKCSKNLLQLLQKTRNKPRDEEREALARLGRNCVNLLYQCEDGLPGKDWSELILDNAELPGADLFRKKLLIYLFEKCYS